MDQRRLAPPGESMWKLLSPRIRRRLAPPQESMWKLLCPERSLYVVFRPLLTHFYKGAWRSRFSVAFLHFYYKGAVNNERAHES